MCRFTIDNHSHVFSRHVVEGMLRRGASAIGGWTRGWRPMALTFEIILPPGGLTNRWQMEEFGLFVD